MTNLKNYLAFLGLCLTISQSFVYPIQAQVLPISDCDSTSDKNSQEIPESAGIEWRPFFIYVFPFLIGYASTAIVMPIEEKISKSNTYTVKAGLVAGKAFSTWLTSTGLRALFRPHSDITEEVAKKLNAGTKEYFSREAKNSEHADIAAANQIFSQTANGMNAKYSIRSQMARANVVRAMLYVMQNVHQAREEIKSNHEDIAAALIADSILYLRTAYAEIMPNNEEVADLVKNNLGKIIQIPANISEKIMGKLQMLDTYFYDAATQSYYQTILAAWEISQTSSPIPIIQEIPTSENKILPDVNTTESSPFSSATEIFIKYSPGLVLHLGFSIIEASPLGAIKAGWVTIKKLIETFKFPFVAALSDPLNKYLESIVQKWTFETKNTEHVLTHGKVRDVSTSFDTIQEETYGHYTQNAQNGRANLARAISIVASNYISPARHALQKNDEILAAGLLANAAYFLRVWHNEISPQDPFIRNSVLVGLSMHSNLTADFRNKIMEKLQQIDSDVIQTKGTKKYYDALLDAWKIGH